MNHRIKSFVFKVLEKLPKTVGDSIYHGLQRVNAKSIGDEFNFQLGTINQFVAEMAKLKLSFTNKKLIEIGSGWLPVLPYELIFRCGAQRVLTFDINEHYQNATIREFNNFCRSQYPKASLSIQTLPELVQYFPNMNILNATIESDSMDVMTSRNVLEHIPPRELELIHKQAYQYLKADSFIIHQISPSDHRAYTDTSLSLWDFLKYSHSEWNHIQTRFDYHNRLRLPDYVNLFNRCGFKIAFLSFRSARKGQELPGKIHTDFSNFSVEELTAGSIMVILVPNKK